MKAFFRILLLPFHGILFLLTRILPRRISGRYYLLSGVLFVSALTSLNSCRVVGVRKCYDVAPSDSIAKTPDNPPPGVKCYDRAVMPDSLKQK